MSSQLSKCFKRFLKLRSYFSPYPRITLKLRHSSVPIKLSICNSKVTATISYTLLQEDIPEDSERMLLEYTILCRKKENLHRQEHLYRELEKLTKANIEIAPHVIPGNKPKSGSINLHDLWVSIRHNYFPTRNDIDNYAVVWSQRKQTRCLASCNIDKKRIIVARAMKHPLSRPFLPPLLYHEMCHAVLGEPKIVKGRRIIHGKEFKTLERRHPEIQLLDRWIAQGGWQKVVRQVEKI